MGKYGILSGIILFFIIASVNTLADDITISTVAPGGYWTAIDKSSLPNGTPTNNIVNTNNYGVVESVVDAEQGLNVGGGVFYQFVSAVKNVTKNQSGSGNGTNVTGVGMGFGYYAGEAPTMEGAKLFAMIAGLALHPGTEDYAGHLGFFTRTIGEVNPVEHMRVTDTGNVGIGTTAPVHKLEVHNGDIFIDDGQYIRMGANADDGVLGRAHSTGFVSLGGGSTNALLLKIGGDEKMRIDASGNVGIGTTAPQTKLNVYGGRTYLQPTAEAYALGFGRTDETGAFYVGAAAGSNTPDLVFSNNAGSELVRIQNTGNVGIGTAAPTSKLQVVELPVYANNAAAKAGNLTAGAFYRTGGDPDLVCVVH